MKCILFTDGGARGNPGPGAAGAVLQDTKGEILNEAGKFLGICTNNEAEYQALLLGLNLAIEAGASALTCYLDSELIVKQLNGEYKVKSETLRPFFKRVVDMSRDFENIKFQHVPRKENKHADKIVNDVLDSQKS